jgi:hypothetical protein
MRKNAQGHEVIMLSLYAMVRAIVVEKWKLSAWPRKVKIRAHHAGIGPVALRANAQSPNPALLAPPGGRAGWRHRKRCRDRLTRLQGRAGHVQT